MNFYVYENWAAKKKAVIPRGECSFCDNGKGIHPNIHGEDNIVEPKTRKLIPNSARRLRNI